jgi:hypothetical protein
MNKKKLEQLRKLASEFLKEYYPLDNYAKRLERRGVGNFINCVENCIE